jgi:hypothetical protein
MEEFGYRNLIVWQKATEDKGGRTEDKRQRTEAEGFARCPKNLFGYLRGRPAFGIIWPLAWS